MLKTVYGDLLQAKETIIAHQVNCFGDAGGLAYHIFRRWPDAGNDYRQVVSRLARNGKQIALLGMAQLTGPQPDGKIIANLYGQYFPGRDFRPLMLERALTALASAAKAMNASVAIPYGISCGICGGDWRLVRRIIEETMKDVDVTIYHLV